MAAEKEKITQVPEEEPKSQTPKRKTKAPEKEPKAQAPKKEPKAQAPKKEPKAQAPKKEPKAQAPKGKAKTEAPEEAPKESKSKPKSRNKPKAAPANNGSDTPTPRFITLYRDQVVPTMMKEFNYENVMEVPRLQKVVLNIGVGEAKDNAKAIESATQDLTIISGQKPIVTRARKAIAGFKIREGMPIGACVTLRGNRMAYFLDRLLNSTLPRIRDFRGVSRSSFDGRGNYSFGIREQVIFPEIDYNQIDRIRGFQITIATTARTDAEAARMLELLGMPFAKQQ
jgi:large subunit ribosomal protein L5